MTTKLQRLQEKPRGMKKLKRILIIQVTWLKTIIVTDQDNFSLSEFTLIIHRYYNVYFHIICADLVYHHKKVIPIYSFFLQSKISLMYLI